MSGTAEQPIPFEEAIRRLEEIVGALEAGDLNLSESLARFEEGMALARACEAQLQAAERRIELLTQSGPVPWSAAPGPNGGPEEPAP